MLFDLSMFLFRSLLQIEMSIHDNDIHNPRPDTYPAID